ncbi:hypothetical protein [Psychroserpens damuponensis]|uniref:hypothetical protein n=1 Tax=Psychroserpens damuponensis TaxID=943936 RepID=UPI00058C1285|nr:hypothetical protein [Psychroserpens damuponensis]
MKTHVLKLGVLTLFLLTFFGCNDCSDCEKENEALNDKLTAITQERSAETNEDNRYLIDTIKRYQVKGGFSTITETINVSIPVTNNNLRIVEEPLVDLSSSNYNAILIRISDPLNGGCTNTSPVTNILSKSYTFKDLKQSTKEALKKDGKLIVIVLNNDTTDLATLIQGYKDSIKKLTSYKVEPCLINNCDKPIKNVKPDKFRPKEDGGDIIVGG